MSDKIRLHYTPQALSPDEREFAIALGHEVSRALAVAAAHPEMSFPAGSLASRVQKTCRKMLRGPKAAAAQARAAQLLQADIATRQKYFPSAGIPGSDAQAVAAAGNDLSAALKSKLTTAVNARLKSTDHASMRTLAEQATQMNLNVLPRTKVETGHFRGDVVTEGTNRVELLAPERVDFRWSTTEPGANAGKWQLVRKRVSLPGQDSARQPALATGVTGAPGSTFTIDLTKWLPPQPPPNGAEIYELRVAAYKHSPTARVPWQMLGGWSLPVIIKYYKSDNPFDFEGANVLRNLTCKLTDVEMTIDSNESGGEEFHIAGFLSETRSDGTSTSWDFAYYRKLDIDTNKSEPLGYIGPPGWVIELGDPDDKSWPKVYTLFVSVMEQDSGDVAPWLKELYGDVKEFVLEKVWEEMKKVLSDLKAAAAAAVLAAVTGAAAAEVAAAAAAEVAAILSAACAALWVMVAIVVAVVIVGEIIEGLDNDSYGSNGEVLVLPTNLYDYFHQVSGEYKSEGNDHAFEMHGGMFFNIESSGIFADQGTIVIGTQFLLEKMEFWAPRTISV